MLGCGEAPKNLMSGQVDLTYTGARWSGPQAFEEAGVAPGDIDYASIYDSFTITVVDDRSRTWAFARRARAAPSSRTVI